MLRRIGCGVGLTLAAAAAMATDLVVTDDEGYRLPTPHFPFEFPRDHGSHPDFKIEWWYITGHLRSEGRREPWGFQATFFRVALRPPHARDAEGLFGVNQLYMAHMALVDPRDGRFIHEERLNRDGWDAYAREGDLDLRNGNWSLRRLQGETMELVGTVQGSVSLELELSPAKPKVIFGKDGVSRKGEAPSAASWYITFPRLAVQGELILNGRRREVVGEAWMDHEISSSQLDEDQVGWDWASLRFDDGREIMVYIMRTSAGTPDIYSTLAWIDRNGRVTHWGPDQFAWRSRRTWTSPVTGGTYPIDIEIATRDPEDGREVTVRLRPLVEAQEMVGHLGGVSYWEGACEILDSRGRRIGEAYVELTGYAEAMGTALK